MSFLTRVYERISFLGGGRVGMKLILGKELHVFTLLFHLVDEIAADFKGDRVHGMLLELAECCLEEVDIFINFFLLAFIEALALI